MKNLNLTTLALVLGAIAWATPQPPHQPLASPRSGVDAISFPAAAGPVEIPAQLDGQPTTVAHLIGIYAAATGQTFIHSPDDANLAQASALGLTEALTVPADRLQTVFEGLLIERDFILQVVSDEGPRILSARSLKTSARNTVRSRATFVTCDQVEVMRGHPAMILTTVFDLPGLDVRQLSNSLRTMITDANTQQLLPAGSSSSLVVTAPGGQLATWVMRLNSLREFEPAPPASEPRAVDGTK